MGEKQVCRIVESFNVKRPKNRWYEARLLTTQGETVILRVDLQDDYHDKWNWKKGSPFFNESKELKKSEELHNNKRAI